MVLIGTCWLSPRVQCSRSGLSIHRITVRRPFESGMTHFALSCWLRFGSHEVGRWRGGLGVCMVLIGTRWHSPTLRCSRSGLTVHRITVRRLFESDMTHFAPSCWLRVGCHEDGRWRMCLVACMVLIGSCWYLLARPLGAVLSLRPHRPPNDRVCRLFESGI